MVETRSKRRRLMLSYVSRRSDIPARFESLNDDTLTTVLEFVGDRSYRSFGGVNKHCKEIYLASGMTKETFVYGYAPLVIIQDRYDNNPSYSAREAVSKGVVCFNRRDILEWALEERKEFVLRPICNVAAEEGRVDLLNEVWNNIDDEYDKKFIFGAVDQSAAGGGRLVVVKWIETKKIDIEKFHCAGEAARCGHINILKWLKEERHLVLSGDLYNDATNRAHLHVMKWLREQEVPWKEYTFKYAAWNGNLKVLQWLHNEGCPWDRSFLVREDRLKPEVIDWCREKGYGNRILSRHLMGL